MKQLYALLTFFIFTFLHADPYSKDQIDEFYTGYVGEQIASFQGAGIPVKGFLSVTLINNNQSVADDDNVWIVILGEQPSTSKQCFVSFDTGSGVGTCVPVTSTTNSKDFAYQLSDLPEGQGGRVVQVPYLISGRIYFSVGRDGNKDNYFLDMLIDSSNKISQPNQLLTTDQNYYILYDKIEFSFPPNDGVIAINTTAVDFFSLPIFVTVQETNPLGDLQKTGYTQKRADIFTQLTTVITTNDKTAGMEWSKLFSKFNGASMRVSSPKNAMKQPTPPSGFVFSPAYLQGTFGYDWILAAWKAFYADTGANKLYIDISEKNLGTWVGQVESGPLFAFKFNQVSNPGNIVTLSLPTDSFPFFAGASFTTTGSGDAAAIIVRDLTAAFDSGLFPLNTSESAPLSKTFFEAQFKLNKFYITNPNLVPPPGDTGPWYDLYSKAIHSFGENIYAFAFDDVLGLDGTTTSVESKRPKVTITLEDMTDTVLPDPYTDGTTYTVKPIFPTSQTQLTHNGVPLSDNVTFQCTIPCVIEGVLIGGTSNTANIYIKFPLVRPAFNGSSGISITDITATTATITFPAP